MLNEQTATTYKTACAMPRNNSYPSGRKAVIPVFVNLGFTAAGLFLLYLYVSHPVLALRIATGGILNIQKVLVFNDKPWPAVGTALLLYAGIRTAINSTPPYLLVPRTERLAPYLPILMGSAALGSLLLRANPFGLFSH
ncbi:hypothetical protein [Nitrospirillum amazonense]|uniref:hypothetical protein n=1 Tax=Nitrospirillum amazonense TaxID=28077 RepID=UPI002412ADA6|nr:hypothetical protein [Nitrospirillum amazonense]MDG3444655.1 hypothetical protein [Nitrospirillum amazonense]